MTQKRLNHVILLNTHKEHLERICIHDIAKEFNLHMWQDIGPNFYL